MYDEVEFTVESKKDYIVYFFHLILCVKYRQKVFTNDEIINRLKEINENIVKKYDVEIVEQE